MKKLRNKCFMVILLVAASVICWLSYSSYKESDRYVISVCLDSAANNKEEIEKALNHFEEGSEKHAAMVFVIKNMLYHSSYTDNINSKCRDVLRNNMPDNPRNLWIMISSSKQERPVLKKDLQTLTAAYLIKNVEEAYAAWKQASWSGEVSMEHFCKYILPYKVADEPVVDWRSVLRSKYSHLVRGITSQGEAYKVVYEYLEQKFKGGSINYPYSQDVLMLDMLQMGSCDLRTLYMVHVMRALGICAVYEYTPAWANYGDSSHSWVALVEKTDRINTYFADTINYIDGSYEKTIFRPEELNYPYSIDSLKRIAKVYRRTFAINKMACECEEKDVPELFKDKYSEDVTPQYRNITTKNRLAVKSDRGDRLYLCTYQQKKGWIPVGIANRINSTTVDVGPLIHDNIVVVAKYIDGTVVPISNPFIVSHDKEPECIQPDGLTLETVRLLRKYIFSNRWANRWGELVGTRIETSKTHKFTNVGTCLYEVREIPTEEVTIMFDEDIAYDYLRIMPADKMYPVFAEIDMVDRKGNIIDDSKYRIYAVGKGLTGDSLVVKSLCDEDLMTTFYKRFPFWLGLDVEKCKNDIGGIRFTMWNDMNQILSDNEYELFYFDKEWHSLGKKKAMRNFLEFDNVPSGALLLLRNYTLGKEERIFVYKNGKQVWW